MVATFAFAAYLAVGKNCTFLSAPAFWVEVGLILLVGATGYWINDVFDRRPDRQHKRRPVVLNRDISAKKVFSVYLGTCLVVLAVSGWLLPYRLIVLNLIAILLLYLYSSVLQRRALLGNLTIALLTLLVVAVGAQFGPERPWALAWAAVFAFAFTLTRELAKDVEDVRGDFLHGLRTVPVVWGLRGARRWVAGLHVFLLLLLHLPWMLELAVNDFAAIDYALVAFTFVGLPLWFSLIEVLRAIRPVDYHRTVVLLKWVIPPGLVSLLLLP